MKYDEKRSGYISPAAATGFVAIALALLFSFFRLELAVIPLGCFVLLCMAAPFFPSRGFFLPVFSRGRTGKAAVSITFDDGPDPLTTRPLLQLLGRYSVKAAFFVTGERAAKYGGLISDILEQGHEVGNHSYHHDPFLMLSPSERLYREIESTQILLKRFGIVPIAFRPPVGVTSPKLADVLLQQGLLCVTFSCRAFDAGNRCIRGLSGRILKKVNPGDIILLHDINPKRGMDIDVWLDEIKMILFGLKNKGLEIVSLAELLGESVMIGIGDDLRRGPRSSGRQENLIYR
jgi:peptidoglycan/xylan/chitin deacetylase (PgdA/CDA1 family)